MTEPSPRATQRGWLPATSVLLPSALSLLLLTGALGGFFVTQRVVQDENRRLLEGRAATVESSLSVSEQTTFGSLRVLADIASSREPGALSVFNRVAASSLDGATAIAATRLSGGEPRILAGTGDVTVGAPLPPELLPLARRALSAPTFVAQMFEEPARLVLAHASGPVVVYKVTPLAPLNAPKPANAEPTPFDDLVIALYASSRPERLVISTGDLPRERVSRQVPVGDDTWLLVVAAKEPLIGGLTRALPWIVLSAGIAVAVLVGLMVGTLARRRAYAEAIVADRTATQQETQRFLESLLLSGPVVVSRLTLPERTVGYLSPNAKRILGIDPTLGTQQAIALHPDDRDRVEAAVDRVAEGTVALEPLEYRLRTGTGAYRWVSDVLVPVFASDTPEVVGVLSYVTDIDARRKTQVALREAQLAAESANQAKSEFLSRMSHELRTPMNAVLGFGQLLEREDLGDRQRESVGYILKAGNHLLTLIDEVLDLSRIESRTMALSPEPVEAREVIVEALDLIGPIARAREVTVQFAEQHGPIPYVLADHQRLKQILLNLLSNAVKYNSRGGSVVVSVALPSAAMVRINVTDTGPGIDSEHRSRLFTPFERLGAEGGPVEGTGIGLALSRHLAWVMGGELDVESEPGRGSTFWLQLPIAEEQVRKFERLNTRTRLERADPMSTQRRDCILQIEDNASNSRLMERVLESRPEFELIVAGLGRLGEDLAREHQPKVVLLDLHLPDVSGEEVLHHLREDPATAHIPVVIVSADGTHGQERRLLNAGAVAYVTKPFDVNELLQIIDNAVSTPTPARTKA